MRQGASWRAIRLESGSSPTHTATSKPSSIRSAMRMLSIRSTEIAGKRAVKSAIAGASCRMPKRRGIDAQLPARSRVRVAYGLLGFLEIGQQPRAALVIGAARLGEADLARRAVQQPRSQPFLEFLHMLADHAGGNAEPRRCAGEAGALHHLGKDPHIVEPVHRVLPIIKQIRMV